MSTERAFAHALLDSIERTTPGGISRRQVMPVSIWRHWATLLAWTLFGILILVGMTAWMLR